MFWHSGQMRMLLKGINCVIYLQHENFRSENDLTRPSENIIHNTRAFRANMNGIVYVPCIFILFYRASLMLCYVHFTCSAMRTDPRKL